jgi:hypothetical protein
MVFPLIGVIEKPAMKISPLWEVAVAKDGYSFRTWDFVYVGDEDNVLIVRCCGGQQSGKDTRKEGITSEFLAAPFKEKPSRGGVQGIIDDLVCEFRKAFRAIIERLLVTGKGLIGFENDKVVNIIPEFVEANFKPVEFGIEEKQVIHLPRTVPLCRDGKPIFSAEIFRLL